MALVAVVTAFLLAGAVPGGHAQSKAAMPEPGTVAVAFCPCPLPEAWPSAVGVDTDDALFIFGGQGANGGPTHRDVMRFDHATHRTTILGNVLPRDVAGGTGAYDGHVVYLFGGMDGQTDVIRFDPARGEAVTLDVQVPAGWFASAAALDGRVYVFAGRDVQPLVWSFDPATLEAKSLRSHPLGSEGHTAVAAGARILVAATTSEASTLYSYDPEGSFTEVASTHALPRAAGLLWDGQRVWLVGGLTESWTLRPDVWVLDPATGVMSLSRQALPDARAGAWIAHNGNAALVVGGYALGGQLASVAVLDLADLTTLDASAAGGGHEAATSAPWASAPWLVAIGVAAVSILVGVGAAWRSLR